MLQGIVYLARGEEELGRHLQHVDPLLQLVALRIVLPAGLSLRGIRSWQLQLGVLTLRHLSEVYVLLAHCEYQHVLLVQLGEGQIHVSEELFLLLLPEGELRQTAAGVREYTFSRHRPQCLFHELVVIVEELLAVDLHCAL